MDNPLCFEGPLVVPLGRPRGILVNVGYLGSTPETRPTAIGHYSVRSILTDTDSLEINALRSPSIRPSRINPFE